MTRRKASRQPVSSFGPQLLAVLLKGARERVAIPCPDQRTMKWLQLRIQTLRGAMEHEKHPQYELVCRARTSRTWDSSVGEDANCILVIQPQDIQFTDMIKAAGVDVTDHERDLLENLESPSTEFSLQDEINRASDPYAKFKTP